MSELPHARFARQPLLTLAVSLAAGILLFHRFSNLKLSWTMTIAGVLALLCAIRVCKRVPMIATASLLVAFLCGGYLLAFVEAQSVAADRIVRLFEQGALQPAEPVELTAEVNGEPETSPNGFYLQVAAEQIRFRGREQSASGTLMLLAHPADPSARAEYERLELHHGARLRVMTVLDRDDDYRNPGVMPFTEYLERKNYDATGVIKSPLLIERLEDARVFLPLAWLYEWRARLNQEFDSHFSIETAGVLDAVLLGNRHNVSRDVADRFREGGTFHVLVIAGLHISFIAGLLFILIRRIVRNRVIQFWSVVGLVFAYALMVGAEAPVIRAAVVFSLGLFAPLVWRRAVSLNIIGGAALALLVWRPSALLDPSFQLTFFSVVAIVTMAVPVMLRLHEVGSWRPTHETPYPPAAPRWFCLLAELLFWSERSWQAELAGSNISYRLFKTAWANRLERWHLQPPLRFVAGAIVVSLSVQLGMLPLLIIYFHRVSLASLAMNIFVGFAMVALALTALTATMIAHVSANASAPLVFLAEKIEWLMVHAIDPISRWAIASIRFPHYQGIAAWLYVFYFLVLGFLVSRLMRWNPLRPADLAPGRAAPDSRCRFALAGFGLLLALIVFHPGSAPRPDGRLHIDFLDVGQGDAALVTMPDGAALLIDGGGQPNIDWHRDEDDESASFVRDARSIGERVVSEFLWARGLDRVDYILPTHADADHIDGLNDVVRNFKVRSAIVARTPIADQEYVRFAQSMGRMGVPIERIGAGDTLRFTDVSIEVLWPPPTNDVAAPWRNNDATVLKIKYGDRAFVFAADIEKEAEARLLQMPADLRGDLVKVAHHGSKTSSTQEFIDATGASTAVISVGRSSIFGHPNREVVERWRASGAQVMTTGEQGTISLVTDGRDLRISTFVQ